MSIHLIRPPGGAPAVQLEFQGAEPGDDSAAGAAMAFLCAQVAQDREACLALVDAPSRELFPPEGAPPLACFGDTIVLLRAVEPFEQSATVRFDLVCQAVPAPIPLAMSCVRIEGRWLIDLAATLALLMANLQSGMSQLAGAMADAAGKLEELGNQLEEAPRETA